MERSGAFEDGNLRERFRQLYPVLKSEVLESPAFEHDSSSRQWVEAMLDYNIPRGKLNRGLSVVETYMLLKKWQEGDENEDDVDGVYLACVVGWCVQWLVGGALILDDIQDNSYTRRGQPCWFRQPNVGMIAINDGIIQGGHVNLILKKHFQDHPHGVEMIELASEVGLQTALGQMLDLISERDLSQFTDEVHTKIAKYKTAYGTFFLPFTCALLVLRKKVEDYEDVKDLLLEIGVYFQVQDDYLDCFGDPEKIGKIGTDIQDFKCSWLIVKALEMCNEEQRKVLHDKYGKVDEASVAAVKEVYKELELERVYAEYEIEVYEKLMARIEVVEDEAVRAVLVHYLEKIHKRQK